MKTRTLLLLLVVLTCASCARAVVPGDGSGGVTSTNVPPGSVTPGPATPRIVTPSPGLVDVRPITWTKADPSSDGMALTVEFWGSPCLSIDHVSVNESPDTVTVTLYQGMLPSMVGSACPDIAMLEAVVVQLSTPLGERRLVDGARGNPPPEPPDTGSGMPPASSGAGA